jgi:hypothetical protein
LRNQPPNSAADIPKSLINLQSHKNHQPFGLVDLESSGSSSRALLNENTVYDATIVAEELAEVGAQWFYAQVANERPILAPGSAPKVALGSDTPNLLPKPDRNTIARAFKDRLARQHGFSSVDTDAYATTFLHDGKFVVVDADAERAEQAMGILRDCGATRVNRHG